MTPDLTAVIIPRTLLIAYANGNGNSARLVFLARHLAQEWGTSGKVETERYIATVADLGKIKKTTVRGWVREALRLGYLRDGGDYIYHISPAKLAARVGRPKIHTGFGEFPTAIHAAVVDPRALATPDFCNVVIWQAYLATQEGRVISRETHYLMTGINRRTQAYWESKANTTKIHNITKRKQEVNKSAANCAAASAELHRCIYNLRGVTYQRFPDIRVHDSTMARTCKLGRSRKYRQELGALLCLVAQEQTSFKRFFYFTMRDALHDREKGHDEEMAVWQCYDGINQWVRLDDELIKAAIAHAQATN